MYENVLAMSVAQQFEVARETNDSELLSIFANNKNHTILRIAAGANSSTSEIDLDKLSKDEEDSVREAVAGNKSTSKKNLRDLLKDPNRCVRARVAGNSSTLIEDLEDAIQDETDWFVLFRILENPIIKDKSLRVIFKNLKDNRYNLEAMLFSSAEESLFEIFMGLIAKHPNAPEDVLEEIMEAQEAA